MERFLYIYWHGDVQYARLIVPVKCDASVDTPSPILCNFIFFLECMCEVQRVLLSLEFDPKVVNHEGKNDSILIVVPQSQSDWRRLISKWSEMYLELRVCYYACMDQPIHYIIHPNIEKVLGSTLAGVGG